MSAGLDFAVSMMQVNTYTKPVVCCPELCQCRLLKNCLVAVPCFVQETDDERAEPARLCMQHHCRCIIHAQIQCQPLCASYVHMDLFVHARAVEHSALDRQSGACDSPSLQMNYIEN